MIGLEDIEAAREAIGPRLHRTPTVGSATLSKLAGARVFLKAELFQKTGSFKPRGVLTNLAALCREERARGVIGISAGNHAQALAWGAAAEGLDALLVMWQGASEAKIEATRGYGARVDLASADPTEAFARLDELVEESGRTLVHPFDHPLTMAGQGTVGMEVMEDVPDAAVVLVPVGGGGLISGTATAVKGIRPQAGESSGSIPITRARGRIPLTAVAVPEIRPPPPTGTSTTAASGTSSITSRPTVP